MTLSTSQVLAWLVAILVLAVGAVAAHASRRASEARKARAAWAQAALELAHAKAEHAAGKMSDEELSKELGRVLRSRGGSAPD